MAMEHKAIGLIPNQIAGEQSMAMDKVMRLDLWTDDQEMLWWN